MTTNYLLTEDSYYDYHDIAASPLGNANRRGNMEQTTNDDLSDHAVERAQRSDAERISEECDALKAMLLEKSRNYGSSALNPIRCFSKSDPAEGIRVRLDDKLSRLIHGRAAGEDVVKDLLGYLILLRIATKEQQPSPLLCNQHGGCGFMSDCAECRSAGGIPEEFLKAAREAPSIVDVLSDPNGPAAQVLFPAMTYRRPEPREDVGFALTDAEAAEAERAVDAEWGGAIRRKLGIARGKLDGVADDLEEVGGWEETVKEIRQTLRETADPHPPARPVEEFLATENKRLQEDLSAAYEAAGISDLENLARHVKKLRTERDALKEKMAFCEEDPGTYAALRAALEHAERERDEALARLAASEHVCGNLHDTVRGLSERLQKAKQERDDAVASKMVAIGQIADHAKRRNDAEWGRVTLTGQRNALWDLLDNIDTLDDSCRDDDRAFRECARKIQRRRFGIYNPEEEAYLQRGQPDADPLETERELRLCRERECAALKAQAALDAREIATLRGDRSRLMRERDACDHC